MPTCPAHIHTNHAHHIQTPPTRQFSEVLFVQHVQHVVKLCRHFLLWFGGLRFFWRWFLLLHERYVVFTDGWLFSLALQVVQEVLAIIGAGGFLGGLRREALGGGKQLILERNVRVSVVYLLQIKCLTHCLTSVGKEYMQWCELLNYNNYCVHVSRWTTLKCLIVHVLLLMRTPVH